MTALDNPNILENDIQSKALVRPHCGKNLPEDFLQDEVEYLMGRFMPEDLVFCPMNNIH
jgi:hypothetical protein